MTTLLIVLSKLIQLMLALSLLVFIHELGHYLAARLFGVRVMRFFLFFDLGGKALFRFKGKKSGTIYGMGWLPIGGYCKLSGQADEQRLATGKPSTPQSDELRAKPAWQRIIVMIAGILFNLIAAYLIYTGISMRWGDTQLYSSDITQGMYFSEAAHKVGFKDNDIILTADGNRLNVFADGFIREIIEAKQVEVLRDGERVSIDIPQDMMQRVIAGKEGFLGIQVPFVADSVPKGSRAYVAGMRKGDQLLQIDSSAVHDVSDARILFRQYEERSVSVNLLRGADTLCLSITPDSMGRVGVYLAPPDKIYRTSHISYNLTDGFVRGVQRANAMLRGYAGDMKYVFTKEGAGEMGGFISMGKLFSGVFDAYSFWNVVAFLSLIFAFMNFLPIPMLDGAEILFALWELVTRKKVDDRVIVKVKSVGLILLIALFLFANLNDVFRLF